MKSEGVKDVVAWMIAECKKQQAVIDELSTRHSYSYSEGESNDRRLLEEQTRLEQMVSWKVSTEKFMKKLRHERS